MDEFDRGDVVTVSTEVRNLAGELVAPTEISIRYRSANGSVTSVPNGSPRIVEDETGLYHIEIAGDISGEWSYAWSTEDPTGLDIGRFFVRHGDF